MQINLSWTAVTSDLPITYSLYRSTAPFTPSPATLIASGLSSSTLAYQDRNVAVSTTYYYEVLAINSLGNATPSNEVNISTPMPPGAFVLTATTISQSEIDLSWTQPTGSGLTYNVYRGLTADFVPSPANIISTGQMPRTLHDTGLNQATTYYYYVEAFSGGLGTLSNEANATTLAIGIITLTATAISNVEIDLSWTIPAGTGTTYNVYRSLTTPFTPGAGNIISTAQSGNTYNDTGRTQNTEYYYYVYANNSLGLARSNEANATTYHGSDFPSGGTVPNLSVTSVGNGTVNLSWVPSIPFDPSAPYTYSLYRSLLAGGVPNVLVATGIPEATTTYSNTGLTNGTNYFYFLVQSTATQNITSNIANATPEAPPEPTVVFDTGSEVYFTNLNFIGTPTDASMVISMKQNFVEYSPFRITISYGGTYGSPRSVTLVSYTGNWVSGVLPVIQNVTNTGFDITGATGEFNSVTTFTVTTS